MPQFRKEGKDTIIFASKKDHEMPSKIVLPEPEPSPGLMLPNGEINWNCPCLGGVATGPCGVEFREAFTCFQYSTGDPKGTECYDVFKTMHNCMVQYPALYGSKAAIMDGLDDDDDDEDEFDEDNEQPSPGDKKTVMGPSENATADKKSTVNTSSTKQEVEQAKTN